MSKLKLNRCQKCGGRLVAEAIGTYGTVLDVKQDGSVGRKLRRMIYEHSGEWMCYCTDCGWNCDFEPWKVVSE